MLITATRDFFCVPQGPIIGPCPNAKYPIFSQFDKTKSQSENKFMKTEVINKYHIFFLSSGYSFFHNMTTCNFRHPLQKIRNIFV